MSKIIHRGLPRLPLAIAVVAALQMAPAFAQDQTPANQATSQPAASTQTQGDQSDKKVKDLETVSVTGSLLKRPEYETTSPVQVLEIKDNIAAGQFDVADVLQTSAVAASSTQINNQFGGYVVEGGTGVQTVNLRGLGSNRTLVLLDGQRPGPAGTRGQVGSFDLNVIPQTVLQRIEIVKDGSSSIYGSDAVAGVVNLITRKSFDRPEITTSFSLPQHGGGEQYSAAFGTGWNFDKGSIVAAAQVDRLEALKFGDRDFLACEQDMVWGKDGKRIDRADKSILEGTNLAGCNNLYANTVMYYWNSNIRYVPSRDGSTVGPFPGYHPQPWDPTKGRYSSSPNYKDDGTAYYESVNNFPFYKDTYAIDQRDRASLYLASNFSFGGVNWSTQWLYNRRETNHHQFRQFFPIVYSEQAEDYIDPSIGAARPSYYQPVMPYPMNSKSVVDYFYGATKLEGLFTSTDSWSWEANASYSRSSGDYSGNVIDARKTGDLGNDYNDLDLPPIDYFDPGILGGERMGELVRAVGANDKGNTVYSQVVANALVTGNVLSLPAGEVGAAFGAEFRQYKIDDQPSEFTKAGYSWGLTSAQVTKGSDHVREAFAEIDVPLLKAIPAVESLSIDLSGRAFKYGSVEDGGNVWKAGFNWQIVPTFRVRGTLGTSYRAPGLYELYLGDQTGFQAQLGIDPCIKWDDSTNERIRANCAAAGIPGDYAASGTTSATIHSGGGKGTLKPETSRAKTLGFVWTPDFANLNVAVDYFDYEVHGEIGTLGAGDIMAGCYGATVYPNEFCSYFTRKPASDPSTPFMITDIHATYINIDKERTRGYDLQVNYDSDLSFGKLSANAQVTYTISDMYRPFDSSSASGFSSDELVGYIGRPKTVGIGNISLKRGDWTYSWQSTYVSSTSTKDISNVVTYAGYEGAVRDIKAGWQFRHSASVGWEHGNWNLMAGVRNLFDKAPDLVSPSAAAVYGNTPINASQYDWYGRTFFGRVSYKF